MLTDTVIEAVDWEDADLPVIAERSAEATLGHLGLDTGAYEIVVLGCDDARIASLNGAFRGRPAPTNVLSWPTEERGAESEGDTPDAPEPGELGDIAIAWGTCAREAEAAGRPVIDHVIHLIVHGVLHLLGYDHERDGDAALMERLETDILCKLGVPDPYAEGGQGALGQTGQIRTDG
ncbi:Endoribonuclease YbeY [Roseivivax jejudonensis]|uniref:Endoribonuclease YbeY n=1 Tax=Roseivivax jejudonensis TaxID=1529041 RepID=A0A1X6Y900_9RHOB|nr:rRNA maturation RNase YbeY [Roseivivax jejudonensis]SLN13792.1 Endoribonuclease YbeY [Roseivivax jejudonensis]